MLPSSAASYQCFEISNARLQARNLPAMHLQLLGMDSDRSKRYPKNK